MKYLKIIVALIFILYSSKSYAEYITYGGLRYIVTNLSPKEVSVTNSSGSIYSGAVRVYDKLYDGYGGNYLVTGVDHAAFQMSNITAITLPYGTIKRIGSYAFFGCSKLQNITIPSGIEVIGQSAFEGLTTNITFGGLPLMIGDYAFSGCTNLTGKVGIMSSVYSGSIGEKAFNNCPKITSVSIPSNISSWGRASFMDCSSLKTISLPNTNIAIPTESFSGCTKIETLSIPDKITRLEEKAFYNCSSLSYIHIGKNVSLIGNNAFENCENLTKVEIGATTPPKLGDNAFSGIPNHAILIVPEGCEAAYIAAGYDKYFNKNFICSGVLKYMGFYYEIIDSTRISIVSQHNINPYNDTFSLYQDTINIPSSITISDKLFKVSGISKNAFRNTTIKQINLPNSINYIGENAFRDCSQLEIINIPDSTQNICKYAFYGCKNLKWLTIPQNVEIIEDYAFDGIDSLNTLNWNAINCTLTKSSFGKQLKKINFGNNVQCIPSYLCYDQDSIKSLYLPNSITTIGDYSFFDCDNITDLVLSDSITSLNEYSFASCDNLSYIEFGLNVAYISPTTFNSCPKINEVIFNAKNCKSNSPILGNSSITKLEIGEDVTIIPDYAFKNCSKIELINLPNSVKTIGKNAFENCTGLTSIQLGTSLSYIGENAFAGIARISKIFSYNQTPPTCADETVFNLVDKEKCHLYVPQSSVAEYKSTYVWWDFNLVSEISGIEKLQSDNVQFIINNGILYIINFSHLENICIYDINGKMLYNGANNNCYNLGKGIYIIKLPHKSYKISI